MEENEDLRQRLIQRIQARRVKIHSFGHDLEQRGNRLTNLSIVCTAITAIFTAGPALGGQNFAINVQQMLGLGSPSSVWQPICLLAVILSAMAAGANNLYKSQEIASRLAKAESCSCAAGWAADRVGVRATDPCPKRPSSTSSISLQCPLSRKIIRYKQHPCRSEAEIEKFCGGRF